MTEINLRDLGLAPRLNALIGQYNAMGEQLRQADDHEAAAIDAQRAPIKAEIDALNARYALVRDQVFAEADRRFPFEVEMFARSWDGKYPSAGEGQNRWEARTLADLEKVYGTLTPGDYREVLAIAMAAQQEADNAGSRASDARRAEFARAESQRAYARVSELYREGFKAALTTNPDFLRSLPSPDRIGWVEPGSPNYERAAAEAAKRGDNPMTTEVRFTNGITTSTRSDGDDRGVFIRTSDRRPATVSRAQRVGDHPVASEMIARSERQDAAIIGQHGSLGGLVRAMTTTGGSAIVPTTWAADVIDKARNLSAVLQAGAQIVPMDSKVVQIGRLTGDPTAAFRAEGSAITASDPTFDNVTLTSKTMSALVIGSMEWFADADNAESIVENAIAQAMAGQLDKVALYGGLNVGGVDLTAATNPVGILSNVTTNASSSVLGGATNGTTQTAASFYNELLDTLYTVKDFNEAPNAAIWNSKAARMYAKAYDSTYQPLRRPADLDALQWFTSNQIPSYTQGTMTSVATDVFMGDFTQCLIGQRLDVSIQVLTERYADNGQIGIVANWRGDVGLARARAFSVYKAIKGA